MTRAIPSRAVTLVRDHEGYRSEAYECAAGRWTLGYGHTLAIKKGQHCTHRQAELWLTEDLTRAAKAVERKIGADVVKELTDNQWAALLDLTFNIGTGDPTKKDWELWRRLRARDFDAVPMQLQRFVYATDPKTGKPRKLAGLVKRRAAEIECWNTGEPGLSHADAPSAELRFAETPPAPLVKPPKTPLVTAAAGCVTACGVAAKAVSDAIQPFATQSPWVGDAVAILATVGAVIVTVTLVLTWIAHRNAKS